MLPSQSTDFYLNMSQFAPMKLAAQQQDASAARAAARQFEGLFIQMMLKDMRAAATFDDSQHSSTMDVYHEMYDRQLAQNLAGRGGIGLARILERQLLPPVDEGHSSQAIRQETADGSGKPLPQYRLPAAHLDSPPLTRMDYRVENPAVRVHQLRAPAERLEPSSGLSLISETPVKFPGWDSPQGFVRDLWPHAQDAAAQLGVSARLLVAQSALETGWGQHAMKRPDGSVAFSLFGIKAGHDWNGERVTRSTLEFRDGSMQREQAQFRAYGSPGEAMADYVDFVRSRDHYGEALQQPGNDEHYIRGLHRGGYATDPAYPDKVLNILHSPILETALAGGQPADNVKEMDHG
jgi:flagellar protein FlgJ